MRRPFSDGAGWTGQKRVLGYITAIVNASKLAVQAAPPILLVGAPGWGKSTIAVALAHLTGANLIRLDADNKTTPAQICEKLSAARMFDLLFIDEVHALSRPAQELLLMLIDSGQLPRLLDNGRLDRFERVNVAPINIVAATTAPGELIPPLLSRLDVSELDPYLPAELKEIARDCAADLGVHLTAQGARAIADRSQGSPRVVCRLVSLLVLTNGGAAELTQSHAETLFAMKGISTHGLTPGQQQYLRLLAATPTGRSSFERLVAQVRLDGGFVRRELEPFLIQLRAIVIETSRVRSITDVGRLIVDELAQETP
jgi:holliday junction DNA helicase RuvB